MQHRPAPAFLQAGDLLQLVAQPEGQDRLVGHDLLAARQRDGKAVAPDAGACGFALDEKGFHLTK